MMMYEPSARKGLTWSGGITALLRPIRGMSRMSLPVCSAALITRIAVAASASG